VRVTALAGGVGAARFLRGLIGVVDPSTVTIVGNTGDDAVFHGLHVSPDLDIVTYTLAGLVDAQTGWGVAGDTTHALGHMASLGVDTWFRLGDRDLGTHLARTTWMAEGLPLSQVTERIRTALGVGATILPASDDPVRTTILTAAGVVREFQEYFVRHGHSEAVAAVRFEGVDSARPAPGVVEAIHSADVVVVCPSNPVVSIGPILAVAGIRAALRERREAVVGISPIVQGAALKGPAAHLLPLLGAEVSASGVAWLYADFCGTFVVDRRDPGEAPKVEALGVRPAVLETVMDTPETARSLASAVVSLSQVRPAAAAETGR
jgi:LPPG:FO 2-phospho-L-lactate transferase